MTYESYIVPALWVLTLGGALTAGVAAAIAKVRAKGADREGHDIESNRPYLAKVIRSRARTAVALLAAALVLVPAVAVVPAGHRGVVYSAAGGVSPAERPEGLTLIVPWAQHLTTMSVRTQKVFSDEVFAQSSDLQEITVVASVNYRVNPALAAELYQRVGAGYQATVIQPALFQRTKAAVGQVRAEDFAANRESLTDTVKAALERQLAGYGIVVEYVNIEDAVFDPAFVTAVKNKVIAEQVAAEQERLIAAEAAKKRQAIIQAEARARSVRIEALAQARANRAIARTLDGDLLTWRLLVTWNGVLPTTLVGAGDGVSFLIDGRSGRTEGAE